MVAPRGGGDVMRKTTGVYKDKSKPTDIRLSNINAAKGNKFVYIHYLLKNIVIQYNFCLSLCIALT